MKLWGKVKGGDDCWGRGVCGKEVGEREGEVVGVKGGDVKQAVKREGERMSM